MTGTALGGGIDYARPYFKGDLEFWRVGAGVEHGIRFFKSHNLVLSLGATFGKNLPFWMENLAGGPNLRGYLYQQFRGDSQLSATPSTTFRCSRSARSTSGPSSSTTCRRSGSATSHRWARASTRRATRPTSAPS